jgi:hypothetical protein
MCFEDDDEEDFLMSTGFEDEPPISNAIAEGLLLWMVGAPRLPRLPVDEGGSNDLESEEDFWGLVTATVLALLGLPLF